MLLTFRENVDSVTCNRYGYGYGYGYEQGHIWNIYDFASSFPFSVFRAAHSHMYTPCILEIKYQKN